MAIVEYPAFLGERNVIDEKNAPIGAMSISSNVDLDNNGIVSCRDGFSLSQAFTAITASFVTDDNQRFFIVDDGDLKLVHEDFSTLTLRDSMPTSYTKWLEVADFVFMNTGYVIDKDLNVVGWRVPEPQQPVVTVVSGALPAGQYQVVTTFMDESGREGAASMPTVVDVGAGSGLTVTPDYQAGYTAITYVTDTNGQTYYLYTESSSGAVTIQQTGLLSYPIDKAQLDADSLPENIGSIAFYEGCVWASVYLEGISYIYQSKPYWWHLFDLHEDYIAIPGKVVALEGSPQGLFIGTDDEMYVHTTEEALIKIADYGVVQGKPVSKTDDGQYYVWTYRGVCRLFPFTNITEDKISVPPGCICSTKIIEKDGYQQFQVLTDGTGMPFNQLV